MWKEKSLEDVCDGNIFANVESLENNNNTTHIKVTETGETEEKADETVEKIIEDDDALDGWMLHQQEENRRKSKQEGVSKTLGKAQNADEVFVMAPDHKDKEHIESIMELNSPAALRRIDTRTTKLEKGVDIEDTYLPDTQAEIKQQLREMNKKTKGI